LLRAWQEPVDRRVTSVDGNFAQSVETRTGRVLKKIKRC
jgi:hypothetical protein